MNVMVDKIRQHNASKVRYHDWRPQHPMQVKVKMIGI